MRSQSLGAHFSRIYRNQQIILNHRFEKFEFGTGQYSFFIAIAHREGLNQREISNHLNVNKATTNKAIKKLEEVGYVKTVVDEQDRRYHRVYLTDKGRGILPDVMAELKTYTDSIGAGMEEEQIEAMFEGLEHIGQNIMGIVEEIRKEKADENKK